MGIIDELRQIDQRAAEEKREREDARRMEEIQRKEEEAKKEREKEEEEKRKKVSKFKEIISTDEDGMDEPRVWKIKYGYRNYYATMGGVSKGEYKTVEKNVIATKRSMLLAKESGDYSNIGLGEVECFRNRSIGGPGEWHLDGEIISIEALSGPETEEERFEQEVMSKKVRRIKYDMQNEELQQKGIFSVGEFEIETTLGEALLLFDEFKKFKTYTQIQKEEERIRIEQEQRKKEANDDNKNKITLKSIRAAIGKIFVKGER